MTPILMTEEYWADSPFSIARHYGGINLNRVHYSIVNKEGKDVFECTKEAEREGRQYAIAPGEPCDLVMDKFIPYYRAIGRDRFLEVLDANHTTQQDDLERIYQEITGINPKKGETTWKKEKKSKRR